jgi:AcrR family transcriptional regulator
MIRFIIRSDDKGNMMAPAANDQEPSRRDAAHNRERVLAVARTLFAQQGVAATSMNQIAHEAGVGAGTLYRNFAHKGEVCLCLLRDDLAAFQQQVRTKLKDTSAPVSALARLSCLLDHLLGMIESNMPLLVGMQEACAGERSKDIYQSAYYLWLNQLFSELLQTAIDQGEIQPLDVAFTADAIFAAIAPPLFVFQQNHRGFDRQRIFAGMQRLFVDGLRIPDIPS